ncbi:MAG TPA: hypothetical protein VNE42_07440 [Acidimicrobiales bacterium]|nr:hypothetical protein [Acidimicrobiales bacterium]
MSSDLLGISLPTLKKPPTRARVPLIVALGLRWSFHRFTRVGTNVHLSMVAYEFIVADIENTTDENRVVTKSAARLLLQKR